MSPYIFLFLGLLTLLVMGIAVIVLANDYGHRLDDEMLKSLEEYENGKR
tara:strand:- start:388 stop:534 length:147 start_codon:yes stop_codon:yes gene_type:complete